MIPSRNYSIITGAVSPMGFRGDLVEPLHAVLGKFIGIPMATATARTYIHADGFVLSADGRVRDSEDRSKPPNDEAQKIFQFGASKSLAYSFTGQIQLTAEGKGDAFDFISQMGEAVESVSPRGYPTLEKYAAELAKPIFRSLEQERLTKNIKLPEDPSVYPGERGSTIARVLIDGYYEGWPSRADVRFYCENHKLAEPQVTPRSLDSGKHLLSGFPEIGDLLNAQDPRFVQYLKPIDKSLSESAALLYAIWFSRAYIDACSGPEALAMNEQICSGIGGRIHIATITPTHGLQWVRGFKPKGIE